ncbi:hypothetical protein VPH35_095435 [Triticum aestivum]
MRGQSGHLVNGSGPHCVNDWREAEVELDITRPRRASLPEQRKKKSHVALELLLASKTSHHNHSFELHRTPFNSHEKRRTGDIGPRSWVADAVAPIGDRFLCWVDYYVGLVLCDVFDANPVHRRRAVKLVSIDPRCCCGDIITPWSECHRSRFSFSITTWTLNVDDGVLYSEELWALPGCELLPRIAAEFPVISMDEPDSLCLMLRSDQRRFIGVDDGDKRIWMIKVDTRKKALQSVVRYASQGNEDGASMTPDRLRPE